MLTKGLTVKKGVGIGEALVLASFQHLCLKTEKKFNLKSELALFTKVRKKVVLQLNLLLTVATTTIEKDVINTHLAMANDEIFCDEVRTKINNGCIAFKAINEVIDNYINELNALNKPFLKARINDLNDVKKLFFDNFDDTKKIVKLTKPTILVIDETSIYHLIYYKNEFLKGVVAREIIKDSHFAILVNALNVPIIISSETNNITTGEQVILDGYKAVIYHGDIPLKMQTKYYNYAKLKEAKKQTALHSLTNYELPLFNDKKISVLGGLSSVLELENDYHYPAGLVAMRTELIFKQKVTKQFQIKTIDNIIKRNPNTDLYLRLFDISYDKKIGIMENDTIKMSPFGLRGIRYLLENKNLFKNQLNACFTAVNNTNNPVTLNLILPFVTTPDEIIQSKKIINDELLSFKAKSHLNNKNLDTVKIGIMMETPAVFFNICEIINLVDYIFIGTSDLHQYMFCDERENNLYEVNELISPFMLMQFHKIVQICRQHQVRLFVCGRLPSNPLGMLLLLSLGYQNFVVNPDKILATSKLIKQLNELKFSIDTQDETDFKSALAKATLLLKDNL